MNNKHGFLENVTFSELNIGEQASLSKKLTQDDINLFAVMSGDINPAHMDPDFAKSDVFQGIVGHGMWSGSLISTILGTMLPGPGTIYLGQNIQFKKPLRLGDTLTLTLTVKNKRDDKPVAIFDCIGVNQRGETILKGEATVLAPTDKIRVPRTELPHVAIHNHDRFHEIIHSCRHFSPMRTAVVHPVKASVLSAVVDAVAENLIIPVLIGPRNKIENAALEAGISLADWEIIDTEHSDAAAAVCRRCTDSEFKERISLRSLKAIGKMAAAPPKQATKSGLQTTSCGACKEHGS